MAAELSEAELDALAARVAARLDGEDDVDVSMSRRQVLASGATVGAAATGGLVAGTQLGEADASTSDSDGDIGNPNDRIDVFADGVDALSVDTERLATTHFASNYADIQSAMDALGTTPGMVIIDQPANPPYSEADIAVPNHTTVLVAADVTKPSGSDANVFKSKGFPPDTNTNGTLATDIRLLDSGGVIDVNDDGTRGNGLEGSGVAIYGEYCRVGDLTITNAERHGIHMYGGQHNTIRSPDISNSIDNGIQLHWHESLNERVGPVKVTGAPDIDGSGNTNVYISGAEDIVVSGGKYENSTNQNIYIYDGDSGLGCNGVTIAEGVTCIGAGGDGVESVESNGGEMKNISIAATILDADTRGVDLQGTIEAPEVSATVRRTGTNEGIFAASTVISPKIDGFLVVAADQMGVTTEADNSVVRGVAKNTQNGRGAFINAQDCVVDIRAYDDQSTKTQSYGIVTASGSDYNQYAGNIRGNINSGIESGTGSNSNTSALIT